LNELGTTDGLQVALGMLIPFDVPSFGVIQFMMKSDEAGNGSSANWIGQ
jgi:hypothetical protein